MACGCNVLLPESRFFQVKVLMNVLPRLKNNCNEKLIGQHPHVWMGLGFPLFPLQCTFLGGSIKFFVRFLPDMVGTYVLVSDDARERRPNQRRH